MATIIWFGIVLIAYALNPEPVYGLLADNWLLFILISALSMTMNKPIISLQVSMRMQGSHDIVHADATKMPQPQNPIGGSKVDAQGKQSTYGFLKGKDN